MRYLDKLEEYNQAPGPKVTFKRSSSTPVSNLPKRPGAKSNQTIHGEPASTEGEPPHRRKEKKAKIPRKPLNYKDETQRYIDAEEKYQSARSKFENLPPGVSRAKTLLQTRMQRAMKVKRARLDRAADKMKALKDHMSYQPIGDVLAEALSRKAKRVVGKLKKSANELYRTGEEKEASGGSEETVKEKAKIANKRMAKAHDIEDQG